MHSITEIDCGQEIPFGNGDESVTVAPATETPAEGDGGSSEPQQGQELSDVTHLLDEMESTRQRIIADPRIADATVKLNATAVPGERKATFGVTVWLHDGRYFYGDGPSLADAELDAMLAASVGYVEAAKRKAVVSR
jgi:hypothetical protein